MPAARITPIHVLIVGAVAVSEPVDQYEVDDCIVPVRLRLYADRPGGAI
jgi:hypothetical protein